MLAPGAFAHRVVIALAIAAVFGVAWFAREALVIAFAGLLVGTLISVPADGLVHKLKLPRKVAVAAVVLIAIGCITGLSFWLGNEIGSQVSQLVQRIPDAIEKVRDWLEQTPVGGALPSRGDEMEDVSVPWGNMAAVSGSALGALMDSVLILAIGLYVAAAPALYRTGVVRLVAPHYRERVDGVLISAGDALRQWLLGQLIAMVLVGIITAVGLKLLGIPLALSLGLLAGLLEFIPFIGPIVFGVIAVMLSFAEGPTAALYTTLFIIFVQQLESNVITPIVQRRTVKLPPAPGLTAIFVFGTIFGVMGILLAMPLAVVAMVIVNELYVKRGLEHERHPAEEPSKTAP
jgi:predicted PurR-regulated permease PerM